MKIKAIIIDDEMHSRETTSMMLNSIDSSIEIVAELCNAMEGAQAINKMKPDLVFLDIQMPGMNGIEMLSLLPNYKGEIIFVTAYDQYAIEAFKKGAMHYLLKPLDPDDLSVAISRVKQSLTNKPQKSNGNWLSLSTQEGWIVLRKGDILRCESFRNYTTIVTEKASHTISKSIKEVEATLSPNQFYRIHNSHIINIEFVEKILKSDGGNVLLSNGDLIPISKAKKKNFYDWFQARIDSI